VNPEARVVIASEINLRIRSISDVSDALGAVYGADGLLLTETDLSPEFFNLHSTIAGELFQKFTNYQIHLAIVVNNLEVYGERFGELAFEHRNHKLIRFFDSVETAKSWLLSEAS
jgi:Domain of unknown function (DUF4180)